MKRRVFLGGLVAGAAGLLVPAPPAIVVPERRVWALDRTMTSDRTPPGLQPMMLTPEAAEEVIRMLKEVDRRVRERREWTRTISTALTFTYQLGEWR